MNELTCMELELKKGIPNFIRLCEESFKKDATDKNVGSKWIPVTERLPEPMVWVLCFCRANIIDVLRYDHIMDDWDTTMPNRCMMKGFVTHWMPLPEPPKEVE